MLEDSLKSHGRTQSLSILDLVVAPASRPKMIKMQRWLWQRLGGYGGWLAGSSGFWHVLAMYKMQLIAIATWNFKVQKVHMSCALTCLPLFMQDWIFAAPTCSGL